MIHSGKSAIIRYFLRILTALLMIGSTTVRAECQFGRLAELPVTMIGLRPLISVKINDQDAAFVVDSGAFWSVMSAGSAQRFGLVQTPASPNFFLKGAGGTASVKIARVKTLTFAGQPLANIDFLVGGNDVTGSASGEIGQNLLHIADVEYDLAEGAIRLWRAKGCARNNLAYWAKDAPLSIVDLMPTTALNSHAVTTVMLNGVKLRAMLSTGASISTLSRSAARRLGVNPGDPGVEASGLSSGVGRHMLPTWIGQFNNFEIGDIKVTHPRLRIIDGDLGDIDMVLGDDFFLSTRVFVATSQNKLYFTYNGGRMFNLATRTGDMALPASASGTTPAPASANPVLPVAAEPTDADGFARRGSALLARGDVDNALADLDKACALAPKNAGYLFARARAHVRKNQPILANADLDAALALEPTDPEMRLARATLRLRAHDPAGGGEDVEAAAANISKQSNDRLQLATLYGRLDLFPKAIAQYDLWIASHKDDAALGMALNGRCWARTLANIELDRALADCNKAVSLLLKNPAALDSRGAVRLRRGEFAQAIADYDAALAGKPGSAASLYGRGLAKIRSGLVAEGKADLAAAARIDADLPERWKRYGLVP